MSPSATALLTAITAAPDDPLPRLVYADWLDDHDQPSHAEAVRRDVARAVERPWADRYWQLPPVGDLPEGYAPLADRQPLLCGVPDDWDSRWRAVRAFVNRWWNVSLGDAGRWGMAVEAAERRIGRKLPPSVKEWVAFSTELAAQKPEAFRGPLGYGRWNAGTGDTVWLLREAKGDLYWGATLSTLDPAVLTLDANGSPYPTFEKHNVYADSVAGFALFYLLSGRRCSEEIWGHAHRKADLTTTCPHAGRIDKADVFERPGAMVMLFPSGEYTPPHEYKLP